MKAYTYNDRLVGVGNDQILGTDHGGGSTYTAGNGIDITNDVISVDDTVALVSALPTTEVGKFTIQNNVSGGPIEVICPTDQARAVYTVLMDSNNVSGTYEFNTNTKGVLFNSPGYDNNYWNYTGGTVNMHVPEAVSGISNIQACYASNTNPTGSPSTGPYFFSGGSSWPIPDQSTYTLQPGDYEITTIANAVPESSGGYGKYISIVGNGPGPDLNALSKISFVGIERNPELGYEVNLDRYYLGNTATTTSPSSLTQATIYTDPVTKKQTVYLPYSMPSNWKSDIIQAFNYGSNYNQPNSSSYDTKQYRAYKYTYSPRRYQFAYCTDWDSANSIMTFIAYDNSGNAIEKWTLNYSNYSSNVWTTESITPDMSDYATEVELQAVSGALDNYVPYSASGVYLPNSRFEIDTAGQAYKIVTDASEIDYTRFDTGIYFRGDGSSSVGTYKATLPSNVHHIYIDTSGGAIVTGTYDIATHSAILNVSLLPSNSECYVFAYDRNSNLIELSGSNTTVKYIVPPVTEEYITDGDLELNDNNQVTAIDGHALAGGGSTYTAGQYISIDSNDVISVTGLAPVSAIPTFTEGNCIDITSNAISWETTAGITDIVSVTALPANPVATVIYLIPET